MKSVKISYCCDYCKQPINIDDDTVCVLLPGRIGYQDSLIMDPEDNVRHYHDYCMEFLLCRTASSDAEKKQEPKAVNTAPKPAPEKPKRQYKRGYAHAPAYTGPFKKGEKDLPGLNALLEAGFSGVECAKEMGRSEGTISKWRSEIADMKAEGTWEAYCEARRDS